MQADAAALMAVHEAEVSDVWVEKDGTGAGPGSDAGAYGKREQHTSAYVSIRQHTSAYVRSDAGAYGKREQRAPGEAFGHREEREERAHAQRIGFPGGTGRIMQGRQRRSISACTLVLLTRRRTPTLLTCADVC